jgi:antitoxin Phd
MEVFNFTTAKQKLAFILQLAEENGKVKLMDKFGNIFTIKPERSMKSPLDVKGIDIHLTSNEILEIIKEDRKYK